MKVNIESDSEGEGDEEEENVVVVEVEQRSPPSLQDAITGRQFERVQVSYDKLVPKLEILSIVPTKVNVWNLNI